MSLFDLIKNKPPIVADSDVPWPPPNKSVEASFEEPLPFLTSSPLFPAKRTPSLREFLNPNYRDRREENEKDSMSETSDLLQAIEKNISSNSLSKTDFDLQRKMRHRSASTGFKLNTEEKLVEKVAKIPGETHTTSMAKNLDSETDCGALETTKPENLQNPALGNLISSGEQQFLQEDNCIVKEVGKCDAFSEPHVFHDENKCQNISEINSKKDGQEDISMFPVSAEKVSASKRKITEIEYGMINEESRKKCKRTSAEEQENKLFTDEHAKAVCTPKRKMEDFKCMMTDRMLIKKAREVSPEDCSGGSREEPRYLVEGLSSVRDDDEKKRRLAHEALILPLKADKGSTQSNNKEEYVDKEYTNHEISVNNDRLHIEEKSSVKTDTCARPSNDEESALDSAKSSLKAQEGSTQSTTVEEPVDKEYIEGVSSEKSDSHTTPGDSSGEERKLDTAKSKLSLKAIERSTQSTTVEEPVDKEYIEGVSSSEKSDSHTTPGDSSGEGRKLDTAKLSLKAQEGSTQSTTVEEPVDKEYIEEASSEKSDSHTTQSSEEQRTLDTAKSKLSLKAPEESAQIRTVEEPVNKEFVEGVSFAKSDSHTTPGDSSGEERKLDTAKLSLKAPEGSAQITTVEELVNKEFVEGVSSEKSDSHTTPGDSSGEERKLDTAKLSLKAPEGSAQITTVEEPVNKEFVEGVSSEKSDSHTTPGDSSGEERKLDTAKSKLSLKVQEGSTQSTTVEEPVDKEYIEEASSEKSDSHTTSGDRGGEERKLDTAKLSLKAQEGSTHSTTVEEPVGKEYIEGVSSKKSDNHTTHSSEDEKLQVTSCNVYELPLKTSEGSRPESTNKESEEQQQLNLTTEEDDNAVLTKEISLKPDTLCNDQKGEDLKVGEQETQELSLMAQAYASPPWTKGENITIDTEKEDRMLEDQNGNNGLEDSLHNNEPETEDPTENSAEISKKQLKDKIQIPQIPQNVRLQTLLRKKIFITDSSESSTETDASEIEFQEATNKIHCPKEVPDNDTHVSKFENSLEGTSDPEKDSIANETNLHQPMASKDLEIIDGHMLTDADAIGAFRGSVSDKDGSDKDDRWDISDLEGDDESLEVLIFKDSDDDDDDDGLEEGEIEADNSEESCELVESILDKSEQDDDPIESQQKPGGQNIGNLRNTKISKSSKKNKRKKKNRLLKQSKVSYQRKSLPPKKTTATDGSRRKALAKPVSDQNICSTSKAAEPANGGRQVIEKESQGEFSLLSTLASTAVMDVTVAASEKELIKKKTRGGKPSAERRKKLQKRWNAYQARKAERRQDIRIEPLPRPLCTYYLSGFCYKGDDCQFRHEGTPTKNPILCKFYASGVCEKGDSCTYQHNAYPCKFYHLETGICKSGIHCRFSHEGPTPETLALFDQLIADSRREQNNSIDAVDGSDNQNELATSPDGNVAPVQINPYSVRYGAINEEETRENLTGVQERGIETKEEPKKAKIKDEEPQNEPSPASRPSYLMPGMYTN